MTRRRGRVGIIGAVGRAFSEVEPSDGKGRREVLGGEKRALRRC